MPADFLKGKQMNEITTKDISKQIYKSIPFTSFLLGQAVKENKISRIRKGYYENNETLQEWIIKTRGFE